jgi:hypothetical protein
VVKQQMSAELNALILEKDSMAHPGTALYLRYMQDCLTQLMDGLSKEKTKEFADLADQWNSAGAKPSIQAK